MARPVARGLLGLLLAAGGAGAAAHDTWLNLSGTPAAQLRTLALQTGERYPLADSGHAPESVARSGCIDAAGTERALRPREAQSTALRMRVRTDSAMALSCWVELKPRQAELADSAAEAYLRDIHAPADIVAHWQELRRRGVAWRESYVKLARVELRGEGAPQRAAPREPLGQGLEILPLGTAQPRAGGALRLRVLHDGRPLEGLAVEFVSERSRFGVWQRSDASGEIAFTFPYAGQWLLRATQLELPSPPSHEWRSRFATLLLNVQ